jgi:hypothetical protein
MHYAELRDVSETLYLAIPNGRQVIALDSFVKDSCLFSLRDERSELPSRYERMPDLCSTCDTYYAQTNKHID